MKILFASAFTLLCYMGIAQTNSLKRSPKMIADTLRTKIHMPILIAGPHDVIKSNTLKKISDKNMVALFWPDNMPCVIPVIKGNIPNAIKRNDNIYKMPNLWEKDSITKQMNPNYKNQ